MRLDSLVPDAACVDLERMEKLVHRETVLLFLKDITELVENPVASSDVEYDGLELH
ncbi:hypothetical protein E2C01_052242 [Portunus trituberculatus]|uniref:Uncharacterized protein n=1 Tax=Portunus trituberculatus TaxID=210409 RepID=A0A5B7GL03_PORTR|nr:hypothetical protein [Portunus trituberculatus]